MGKIVEAIKQHTNLVKDTVNNAKYSRHIEKAGGLCFLTPDKLMKEKGSLAAYDRLSSDLFKYDRIDDILADRALVETFKPEGKNTFGGTIWEEKTDTEAQNDLIKDVLTGVQRGTKSGKIPNLNFTELTALFACGSAELLQAQVDVNGEKTSVGDYYVSYIDDQKRIELNKMHYSFYNDTEKTYDQLKANAEIVNKASFDFIKNQGEEIIDNNLCILE